MQHQDDNQILDTLQELLKDGAELARGYREIGEINHSFVAGDQWGSIILGSSQTTITRDDWPDDSDYPRIAVNQLAGAVDVKVSLLTKTRPCAVARPHDDSIDDLWACESVNQIIKYLINEIKTAEKIHDAARNACITGSGGIKIWFDPSTRLPQWAPVSVDQIVIDPWATESVQDAEWVVFHRWFSPREAKKMLHSAGIDVEEPGRKEYKTISGITRKGVEAHEIWHKPCEQYPDGLYALIVDNSVVEAMPYPYVTERNGRRDYIIPLVWMRDRKVPECIYGSTSTTLCVPLQRRINLTAAAIARIVDTHAHPTYVVPADIADSWDPMRTQVIGVSPGDTVKPAVLQPAPVSKEMYESLDYYRRSLLEVIGLNEITTGADHASRSGAAIEAAAELDAQKNAAFSRSIESAVLDAYRISLQLMQSFVDDNTLYEITNQGEMGTMIFRRADVDGVTARLEIGSELDLLQPAEELIAKERFDAGLTGEDTLKGAVNDPSYAFSKQLGEWAVEMALARQPVDINPGDADLGVVLKVVLKHKRLALLEGRQEDFGILEQLSSFIRSLAQQAQQQAPQQQQQQQQQQRQQRPQDEAPQQGAS